MHLSLRFHARVHARALAIFALPALVAIPGARPGLGSVDIRRGSPAADSVPRYDLSVRLDPERRRLEASGTLTLPPASSDRTEVSLTLHEAMRLTEVRLVAPEWAAGAAAVDTVARERGDLRLRVRLPQTLPRGRRASLSLKFEGGSATPGFLFYLGGDVIYASGWGTNWYPAPGDGSIKVTGRLRVFTPASHPVVLASGGRPLRANRETGWHAFELPRPTYLSFVAGRFVQTRVQRPGSAPVTVYVAEARAGDTAQARAAAAALEVLERTFGRYRWDSLAVVEYPDTLARRLGFNAAAEPGMLVLKGGFLRSNPSSANYGHELTHQWWPNVTGFRRPASLLAEGMANYGAFRVVEALEGHAAAERFRRTGDPGFNGDISAWFYLRHAAAGFDTALVAFREGTFPGRNMGGTKGAFVFESLAHEMGRDRMHRALTRLLDRHEHGTVSVEMFEAAMSAAAGRDLKWFVRQWFDREGVPHWEAAWRQRAGRLHLEVTQPPPYYRATLPVIVTGASGAATVHRIVVDGPRSSFAWPTTESVTRVEVDPAFRVLRWTASLRSRADALAPVTRARAARSVDGLRAVLRTLPQPDVHGVTFVTHVSLAELLLDADRVGEAAAHARAALEAAVRDPEQLSLAYGVLALDARQRRDTTRFQEAVANAIAADAVAGIPGPSVWVRALRMP